MKYLGYVESPLQAFNLMEYVDFYNIDIDVLVVNSKSLISSTNHSQILSVIKFLRFKEVVFLDLESNKKNLFKIKHFANENNFLKKSFDEDITLIGGEYRSMVFWFIAKKFKRRKVVILDDGTATLRINRKQRPSKVLIKDLILKMIGCADPFKEKISFFSIYDISDNVSLHDSVTKHSYSSFANKTIHYPDDNNSVYVIGTPLFEAGVIKGNDIEITFSMLSSLKEMFAEKKVIYIPHRRERKEKIDAIAKMVHVQTLDYPFELFSLINKKNIRYMGGFYSSLFDNMLYIYNGNLSISSFYVPGEVIFPSWQEFVESVYTNYKRYNSPSFTFKELE